MRYFILHHLGGVYLDADVLCYRPAHDMWAGADIVLQGTADPEWLASGVLASKPRHPFWMHVVRVMQLRFEQFRDELGHVLDLTGPFMLRDALKVGSTARCAFQAGESYLITCITALATKEYLFGSDAAEWNERVKEGSYIVPGLQPSSLVKIHGIGTYFTPCTWNDGTCHARMAKQQRLGTTPPYLAGYHQYRSSW